MENNDPKESAVRQFDLNKICRACLTDEGEMRSVFFSDTNNLTQSLPLADMLMAFSAVHITSGDGLPELICIHCVDQVSRVFTFKQLCERSESFLRNYLGKPMHLQEELQQRQPIIPSYPKQNEYSRPDLSSKPEPSVKQQQNDSYNDSMLYLDSLGLDDDSDDDSDAKTDILLIDSPNEPNAKVGNEKEIAQRQLNRASRLHKTRLEVKKKLMAGKISKKAAKKLIKNKTHTCAVCAKSFINMQSFRKHLRAHIEDRPFKCKECPRKFTEENYLNNHMRTHLPEDQKPLECNVCRKRFIHSTLLSKHLMKHSGEKPYVCKICNKGCYAENSLLKHMKIHERKQGDPTNIKHICDYCKMEFTDEESLGIHIKQHTGDRPFLCTICGKCFPQRFNLELHLRTHTGERPFECEVCKNGYVSKASLKIHMRTHTNERPFVCDFCGKAFRQSGDLTSHKRLHGTEKPIECNVCRKRFTTVMKLKYHMRNHTGERPYVCQICNRGFTVNTILLRHMRVHSGERPYVCVICGKAFSQSSTLNTHMKVHSSTPKFPQEQRCKVEYQPQERIIRQQQPLDPQLLMPQHHRLLDPNDRGLMNDVQMNQQHDNRLIDNTGRMMSNDNMDPLNMLTSNEVDPIAANENRLLLDNSRILTGKYLVNYDPYHHRGHL